MDLDPLGADPLGILKVSWLYCPGVWAAWFLTFICATFGDSNISLAFYILYSMAAGVDLLSQYLRIVQRNGGLALANELGALGAAYTVAWTSMEYSFTILCIYTWKEKVRALKQTRNVAILWAPTVVALIIFGRAARVDENSLHVFTIHTLEQFPAHLEVVDGMRQNFYGVLYFLWLDWVFHGLFPMFLIVSSLLLEYSGSVTPHMTLGYFWKIILLGCVMMCLPLLAWVIYPVWRIVVYPFYFFNHGAGSYQTSDRIPYTHHNLFDLEQAFALVLEIGVFVWDLGPGFARPLRRKFLGRDSDGYLFAKSLGRKKDLSSKA